MHKIARHASFDDLSTEHAKLFEHASRHLGIFASLPWFRHLAATTAAPQSTLCIYALESNDDKHTPQFIVPMWQQRRRHWYSPRTLTALSNWYSALFSPIGTAPLNPENFTLLAQTFSAEAWDTIDLRPLASDCASFSGLRLALERAGMVTQRYFCFGNWYLQVQGRTYQEYYAGLPARLRHTLERKSRQLQKTNHLSIEVLTGTDEASRAIAAFENIYQASWKSAEPYPDFMPGLIRLCAEHGWLRMGIAYIDGQPAAAQLWIVVSNKAEIYKLAYDSRFSGFSIGSILSAHMMQHAIDIDQVNEIDYLSGDDAYKQDWMSHRRERWGLIAFNLRTPIGILSACKHIGGRMLKNMGRRLKRTRRSVASDAPDC